MGLFMEQNKMADQVTVYAYVCADLIHVGHKRALEQAKMLGDILIVGVLTDDAIIAYKRKPIIPFDERLEMVQALRCVDFAVKQTTLDPTENLMRIQPDIVVHGDDWGDDFPGAEYMRSIGKKAIRIKYTSGISTTEIIERIKQRYCQ